MKLVFVVLTLAVVLLATPYVGMVNAAPRTLKQCNMVYWTSTNPIVDEVAGNQVSDFKLELNGNPDPNFYYYLDIKFIKPTLDEMEDGWWLTPPTGELGTAFYDYWNAKGVNNLAPRWLDPPTNSILNWKWVMWRIIRPTAAGGPFFPMFMLVSDGQGNYMMVDGLQFWYSIMTTGAPVYNHLRLNGDYPKGTYTFWADLEIHDPVDFKYEISITFR